MHTNSSFNMHTNSSYNMHTNSSYNMHTNSSYDMHTNSSYNMNTHTALTTCTQTALTACTIAPTQFLQYAHCTVHEPLSPGVIVTFPIRIVSKIREYITRHHLGLFLSFDFVEIFEFARIRRLTSMSSPQRKNFWTLWSAVSTTLTWNTNCSSMFSIVTLMGLMDRKTGVRKFRDTLPLRRSVF